MAIKYSTRVLGYILGFNYKLNPECHCFVVDEKRNFLNDKMRRKSHGSSSQSEMLVT